MTYFFSHKFANSIMTSAILLESEKKKNMQKKSRFQCLNAIVTFASIAGIPNVA